MQQQQGGQPLAAQQQQQQHAAAVAASRQMQLNGSVYGGQGSPSPRPGTPGMVRTMSASHLPSHNCCVLSAIPAP